MTPRPSRRVQALSWYVLYPTFLFVPIPHHCNTHSFTQIRYSGFDSMSNSTTYPPMSQETQDLLFLQQQQQQQDANNNILSSIEFTDLTNSVFEDRRRRESSPVTDKKAITNMRIVRCSVPTLAFHGLPFTSPPSPPSPLPIQHNSTYSNGNDNRDAEPRIAPPNAPFVNAKKATFSISNRKIPPSKPNSPNCRNCIRRCRKRRRGYKRRWKG